MDDSKTTSDFTLVDTQGIKKNKKVTLDITTLNRRHGLQQTFLSDFR